MYINISVQMDIKKLYMLMMFSLRVVNDNTGVDSRCLIMHFYHKRNTVSIFRDIIFNNCQFKIYL